MTIKSFRQRAEELEREEFSPASLNGMYAGEFQEWLRESRNKLYNYSIIDMHSNFKSYIEVSLNKIDIDIKHLGSSLTQSSSKIIINSLPSEYIQNFKSVFFNELDNEYEVKSQVKNGEDKAA